MKAPYIGALLVARFMDNIRPGQGQVFLADPDGDATLIHGRDVDFRTLSVGILIILPTTGKESSEQQSIAEVV